ncbi:MAG: hypothetical protein K0Q68_2885 [Moraxellaceae bacterium]|jgi:uncharacterized protein involved in outer membrane biogenesis|nr:hypothetical protein [Moraxellaceae bacterium]
MRTAALAEALRQHLTPRRRRHGLVLLGVFLAYSLLGWLALPGVVVSQAQKFVAEKLHLELAITELSVNPWKLAVRIRGLSIREPGPRGEVLVAADSLLVNAQLWSSLWLRGASLAELELQKPYLNVRIHPDGRINLLQLLPPEDPADTGEARWRIGRLAVQQGRIAFRDDTRPTSFAATFEPLNLALTDMASRPDRDGLYTLHAETGDGEALDWRGNLSMQPVRSEGELKITGLRATTPWRYLQDQLPLVVEGGSIGISGHYRLKVDNGVEFSLADGQVNVSGLQGQLRGEAPLAFHLGKLDLTGVRLEWPRQEAGFTALTLADMKLTGAGDSRPLAGFASLGFREARFLPAGQQVSLDGISLKGLLLADGDSAPLLALPALGVERFAVALEKRQAHVARISLDNGDLSVRREQDGRLNWQNRLQRLATDIERGLVPPAARLASAGDKGEAGALAVPASAAASTRSTGAAPAWTASLGELDLREFRIGLNDLQPATPVASSLEHINLRLLPRQQPGEPHRLEGSLDIGTGGKLTLAGRLAEQPLAVNADLTLSGLRLPPFAPYFADVARFALEDGALDVSGHLDFAQAKKTSAAFRGQVAVRDFSANDLDQDERFLAWKTLAARGIDWQLAPGRLVIRDIEADRPFMRLIMGADKTLNLSHVIVSAPVAPAAAAVTPPVAAASAAPAYPFRVDRIRINNGAMLFADLTLKPQFATGIQSLTGDITGISSAPAARATITLKGRVDQYGKAAITGSVNPLASDRFTDLKVRFSDLELTTLTPYSAKFAGYRIDKGKLSLDLGYLIKDRQLEATNKVVFNQLTLGEKVESPDAMNLPLKLAVAILRDKDGVIDVDLPLTGSLDDPQFRVAPLVWKAFLNLVTKAATAPFSLIAGLVGGGDDMDALAFPAGETRLAPEQLEKLASLSRALEQRPALGVEIRGAFDPEADALALRTARFEAGYAKRLVDGGKPRKVLEALFTEKLGAEALARQRALSLKPSEGGDLQLAEDSYLASLRAELVARETILEGDLRQLALERARVLRAELAETHRIEASRIFVLEPVTTTAAEGKVILKVTLTAA